MPNPPRFAERFLKWYCPERLYEAIEGDLLEQFDADCKTHSPARARQKYLWNVIRFFRPGILFRNQMQSQKLNLMLFRNYFVIALRLIRNNPTYTSINLIGLVVGIASFLIIHSIIRFEASYDTFHSNHENIYRLVRVSEVEGATEYRSSVSYPVAGALQRDIPALDKITSILYWGWGSIWTEIPDSTANKPRQFVEPKGFAMVEPEFFDIFDFKDSDFEWIAGSPKVLEGPESLVLTKSIAEKYFPDENPIGKVVIIDHYWKCTVKGVISDLPANTDFPITILISYSTLRQSIGDRMNSWSSVSSNENYLVLPEGMSKAEMEARIDEVHAAYAPESIWSYRKYRLQPLSELHRDDRFGNFNRRTVSDERLIILSVVGVFLLLVACINYMNLSTAQSYLRSKEVGIRKVMGGFKRELITQFLFEAFVLASLAGILGFIVAEASISNFQGLLSVPTGHSLVNDSFILLGTVGIILAVTFLAGLYPAFVISGFKPVSAVKKNLSGDHGSMLFRKSLVAFQFSITQISLIATVVIGSQMAHFQNVDLGFDKEAIISVTVPEDVQRQQLFLDQLRNNPKIAAASLSSTVPSGNARNFNYWDFRRSDWPKEQEVIFELQRVDENYIDLYDIQLLAGRNFFESDTMNSVIINETLLKKLEFYSPEEAIGETLLAGHRRMQVIGVIKDFHTRSLKEELDKVALTRAPDDYGLASIKFVNTTDLSTTLTQIEDTWSGIYPDFAFSYTFFDQRIETYYEQERKFSNLFQIFSSVFILIGCLGLYGLIAFVVHKKLKELAIRKVFGARALDIIKVISLDYFPLIILSLVIATPVAYYFMDEWLNNFVYRIEIKWLLLLLPALILLGIALLAVSGQTMKAIKSNPATILKDE